ncbi:MAG TPA: CPBP family intramembrane glutamic endopeptidase, partial [Elusimicrobiota bacterium]|nr:CPBP family intramembrane glutamic endopeptidase [Elusimicrobiota bacterium]
MNEPRRARSWEILRSCAAAVAVGGICGGLLRIWVAPSTQAAWFSVIVGANVPRLAVWAYLWRQDRRRWRCARIGFEGEPARALGHAALMLGAWSIFWLGSSGPAWSPAQRLGGTLTSCVVGGFEEFVFRGLLLEAFGGLLKRPQAVLASALAFTLIHLHVESIPSWPHIFLTGAVLANLRVGGLGLGWLAMIHAAVDSAFFFTGFNGAGPQGPRYALF